MPHTETVPQALGALPVIGHLARLGLDPLRFFVELHACGPLVRIRLGHRTVYVVTSADLVQHMLVANHGDYDRGGPFMDSARALLGNGLPACPDSVQRVQRPLLQAAFQRNQMPRYIERMAAFTARSVAAWPCGRVIDADTEMRQLATGNLTQSLFRDPVVGRLVTQFQHDLPIVMDGLARRVVLPISGRLPFPGNRRFTRAVRPRSSPMPTASYPTGG